MGAMHSGNKIRVCKLLLVNMVAFVLKDQKKKKRFRAMVRKGPGELSPPVPAQA